MTVVRLIVKDLRLQRAFLFLLVPLEVAAALIFLLQLPAEMPGVALGLVHGIALVGGFLICFRTMVAEEKNRALLFLKTLPVSTREIVVAKFGVNLLLVTATSGLLFALYQGAAGTGLLAGQPVLGPGSLALAVVLQWLNNAFFLTVSLIFDSEKAVWVPFPVVFILMSLILNFRRIVALLHLQPILPLVGRHQSLIFAGVVAACCGLCWLSIEVMSRKKVFG